MRHWAQVLCAGAGERGGQGESARGKAGERREEREKGERASRDDSLTQILIIPPSLTLPKQNLQTLIHIDPQKLVSIPHRSGQ